MGANVSKTVEPSLLKSNKAVFTIRETARIAEVCDATVRKLIRLSELPAVRVGRSYRVPRRALLKLIGEN
jgi:excisionase family DNA binding protein